MIPARSAAAFAAKATRTDAASRRGRVSLRAGRRRPEIRLLAPEYGYETQPDL
ncbi:MULTISPECIES: hypothetical protein [unclassified Methanoculleus]|uniref:hypothetical protein n=1 Tax=unclassified Methanoculleus TaxID=2619537 RepID=UPI0025F0E4D6|nr:MULTISPECIES: hypothetical protein [unclassified Methanoculleus]